MYKIVRNDGERAGRTKGKPILIGAAPSKGEVLRSLTNCGAEEARRARRRPGAVEGFHDNRTTAYALNNLLKSFIN